MASASATLGTAKPPSAAGASAGSFAMAKGLAALEPEALAASTKPGSDPA